MAQLYVLIHRWPLLLAVCLMLAGVAAPAAAQTYQLPASGTAAYTTCSGALYDDGGPNGNYSANANGTVTLTPAIAGNKIRLDFTSLNMESGYDYVYIYDGADIYAPLIGYYSGYASAFTVYATNSAGKLTVRLTSDYTAQYSGFAATISCVSTVPLPDLVIQSPSAQPLAVVPGGSLSASCSIANLASVSASSSNVGYYLSTDAVLSANDVLVGSSYGYALGGNQSSYRSAYLSVPTSVAVGNYYLLFVADYQNQVVESNEANNTASLAISVLASFVDLTIQQPYVSANTAPAGGVLGLSCYIANLGNAQASSSYVGYYLSTDAVLSANDVLLGSSYGGTLSGGSYGSYRGISTSVPAATAPGNYYVLFVADYQNLVVESTKANNVSAVGLTVVTPSIDLTVIQAQVNPTTTTAGSVVGATANVVNQGNAPANSSRLGVYFSTDAVLSANDVLLASESVPGLGASGSYYVYPQFTVPTTTAPGTYYVLFVADYQNQVAETNETNNVRSVALTVALPAVDLVITQPSLSPGTTLAGSYVYTDCYIQNLGNTAAALTNIGYYLSTDAVLSANDVLLNTTSGGALNGGTSSYRSGAVTVPAATAPGSYYLLFVADYQNQVAETNENNNVSSASLTVLPATVDLLIQQAQLNQAATPAGLAVTADSYIVNQGNSTATSSDVGYYLSTDAVLSANDVLLGNSPGGVIYANNYSSRSATLTIPGTTAPGSYYVLFVADYQNKVAETNENNNVSSVPLLVSPPFTGTVVPYSGTASITTCNTTVYDHGGPNNYANYANGTLVIHPATAGSKVQLGFNSFQLDGGGDRLSVYDGPTTSAPLIGSYSYTSPGVITATSSSGSLTLVFTSDGYGNYAGFEAVVSCLSGTNTLPDLAPFLFNTSPTSGLAGSPLFVQTGIRNQGGGSAASSAVGYYLSTDNLLDASDVPLGVLAGGSLAPNQSINRSGQVTIPGTTVGGTYYLLHVADPQNAVAESNETNNVVNSLIRITVPPLPDLVITQPTLSHTSRTAGTVLTVSCELRNQGTNFAPPSVVGFYLSADAIFSPNDVLLANYQAAELSPGTLLRAASTFVLPGSITAGSYHVLFVADYVQDIGESNESNNVAALPLTITVIQAAHNEQLAGLTLTVFPNPATVGQSFKVELDGPATGRKAELQLFDALGREVEHRSLLLTNPHGAQVFDTRNLPRGVYLLRLTGEGLNATRRIQVD
ncbi:CARDB domain-containing protein [Hymenobacter rubripertinctus]|uniref:T9SS C-terminal target domain-containing protein n=1 Tax=Hymenobacter rubripertinctus TaxID=2029981 RepID=A0A418RA63_9BACT|nr:CARDB domain-containing protein [Hymenobacter rubripertinctus]RIY14182.1 T9SS C-terminal target domain-containing protein [Hymenobacter rubripertinctus]